MSRGAFGIVLDKDKSRILLIKRRDVPVWVLPGGGIENNETPEQATEREVFEETGVAVKIERLVAKHTATNRLTRDSYIFECQQIGGSPTINSEAREVEFFSLEQLPEPFFFLHKIWIDEALLRLPSPIVSPITQITYTKLFIYLFKHPLLVFRAICSRLGIPINTG